MDNLAVIIVAGGSGARMDSPTPKQFLPLGGEGKPVLVHTLERFVAAAPAARIVVALPQDEIARWEQICDRYGLGATHTVCAGGETRFHSVRNALAVVADARLVAVHDGVRPLVSAELIGRVFEAARQHGAAIPVVEPVDSLRLLDDAGGSAACDRRRIRAVQTPQAFRREIIVAAYKTVYDPRFTDDASVVESAGTPVVLCAGDAANIKITAPTDLAVAQALLEAGY